MFIPLVMLSLPITAAYILLFLLTMYTLSFGFKLSISLIRLNPLESNNLTITSETSLSVLPLFKKSM